MNEQKKFLDANGIRILWDKISMQDYPNNATLMAVINAIDSTKADKEEVPEVDATLSISGSAADAKAVGKAIENIELTPGPKGDSGVYVGASAPTDESVNVWINPSGEAINLPTGGDTDYRLIYQITIDENNQVSRFIITEDMDGNSFELTKVFVYANTKGCETGRSDAGITFNDTVGISWVFNIDTNEYLRAFAAEVIGDNVYFKIHDTIDKSNGYASYNKFGVRKINSKINKIQWATFSGLKLPIGSTFTIYGC